MVAPRFLSLLLTGTLMIACGPDTSSSDAERLPEAAPVAGVGLTAEEVAAAAAAAPSVPFAQANIENIQLRVKVGTAFKYRLTQKTISRQDSVEATTIGYYVYSLRVKGVGKDGSVEMGMRFDTVRLSMEARRELTNQVITKNSFSSTDSNDVKDPRNLNYTALIGQEATIVLSSTGEIKEIRDMEAIMERILGKVPDKQRITPQVRAYMTDQLKTLMFSTSIGQQFVPYPEGSISAEGTWSRQQESPIGQLFIVSTNTKYQITGVKTINDHQVASVDASLTGSMKLGTAPPDATSKLTLNRSTITGTSQAMLDLQTGMTISKQTNMQQSVMATTTALDDSASHVLRQQQDISFTVELIQ